MKIGFFTDVYLPNAFGTEISIENSRKKLEELGHQVYVFAPFFPKYKDINPKVCRFHSLKIVEKPEMRFAFPFLPVNHWKRFFNIKLDIVHAHTPFNLGLLGKFFASRQKIPIIYTHHTQYQEYAKVYFKGRVLLPKIAKDWCVWYANQTDKIIAPSYKMKRFLKGSGVKKPVVILPTGIDFSFFEKPQKEKGKLKEKLNIDSEKKILLSLGRISKEKNPTFLLKIMKIILSKRRDIMFLMVGGGADLEKLKTLARNLKIDKFVKFAGQVPHSEVPAYYQASDIFVFSSLTETQGLVVLEAIANSLPVVALKDEVFKGVIVDNKNGFLIGKQSPEIFSQKVLKILNSPNLYKKFSFNAQKIAKGFSNENQTRKLLQIYQELIKKKKSEFGKTNI